MNITSRTPADDGTSNRRRFLRSLAIGSVAGAALTLAPQELSATNRRGVRRGELMRDFPAIQQRFRDIQRHENEHVHFLVGALGGLARPKPMFKNLRQYSLEAFVEVAQALENTGCGAYLGAAPHIENRETLAAAGSIALIEGRHAGWVNTLVNAPITENVFGQEQSFETPLTPGQVEILAGPFVASLSGGPPLAYDDTGALSPANDVAILNFALALEYLEAEYYNVNVPAFFETRRRGR